MEKKADRTEINRINDSSSESTRYTTQHKIIHAPRNGNEYVLRRTRRGLELFEGRLPSGVKKLGKVEQRKASSGIAPASKMEDDARLHGAEEVVAGCTCGVVEEILLRYGAIAGLE